MLWIAFDLNDAEEIGQTIPSCDCLEDGQCSIDYWHFSFHFYLSSFQESRMALWQICSCFSTWIFPRPDSSFFRETSFSWCWIVVIRVEIWISQSVSCSYLSIALILFPFSRLKSFCVFSLCCCVVCVKVKH